MSIQRILLDKQPFNEAQPESWRGRGQWPAQWLSVAAEPPFVVAYRLEFELETAASFRIHVTGDERYELFWNGELVGRGPERGDRENWFFESFEANLQAGTHLFVARVWALGEKAAFAQMSVRPGFLLAAEGQGAPEIHTGAAPWTAKILDGYEWQSPVCPWGIGWTGWNENVRGDAYDWDHERGQGLGWCEPQKGCCGHAARLAVESTDLSSPASGDFATDVGRAAPRGGGALCGGVASTPGAGNPDSGRQFARKRSGELARPAARRQTAGNRPAHAAACAH